jgi:apolipoprotein N-acyltransferase
MRHKSTEDRNRKSNIAEPAQGQGACGALPLPLWLRWLASPWWLSILANLCLWAALPPLRFTVLGWLAPVFWLRVIVLPELPGRRVYWKIWLSSVLFWIAVMQGIRLAHWATYIGLVAMGLYLGIYLPLFVALARHAVHQWRVPLILAAPVTWTGVELARGYGPLGFSMATLSLTQAPHHRVIQVADLCGAYTLSFIMMMVAACVVAALPHRPHRIRTRWWPLGLAATAIAVTLLYGQFRMTQAAPADAAQSRMLRVALIQGSIDTMFEDNQDRPQQIMDEYVELTNHALRRYGRVDLVVWPESMLPLFDILMQPDVDLQIEPPLEASDLEDGQVLFERMIHNRARSMNTAEMEGSPDGTTQWLAGVATWQFGDYPTRRYNTALFVDHRGDIVARYYKMHPVIFGEYVPFGEWIPALYQFFPLPNGLNSGTDPVAATINGLRISPSICFESTIPHLIRGHVAELKRRGMAPDVLVNLTNDGWFWGSSVLDLQLDCAVLRAVELRRPFLVAANTGFSAWIDGSGRVLAQGPRHATGTLLAEVVPDGRWSGYEAWGDLPALSCAAVCLAIAIALVRRVWRKRPDRTTQGTVQLA